jgi:ribosomal-protein-alanine N-acetyltransferase
MTTGRVNVRRALPSDEPLVKELSLSARRVVLHIPWTDLRRALLAPAPGADPSDRPALARDRAYDVHVAERGGRPGCLWVSIIESPSVAQLRALILHDDWPLLDTLGALLPRVRRALHEAEVTLLAYVGTERWLLDGLAANGFAQTNTVVTLQKSGWGIPSTGNQSAVVRRATESDFGDILDIDRLAFAPLWRNTPLTLAEFLSGSSYFYVAELEQHVVGYVHASLVGRHGHLTRIAVHPQFQGQQVGVRLLADVLSFFRRQRVFGVTVNTQRDNVRARRLYEWFGFVVLGQEAEVWTIAP